MGTVVAKRTAIALSNLASEINENHELARMYVGQAFDHAVKAGLLLIEAKRQVPHGQWKQWVKANLKVGERQAQNYMKVASCPDEKRNTVADLSLRKAIHELAAHKVQEGDREAARALTSPKDFVPIEPADEPDDDERPTVIEVIEEDAEGKVSKRKVEVEKIHLACLSAPCGTLHSVIDRKATWSLPRMPCARYGIGQRVTPRLTYSITSSGSPTRWL
jgi:hypothetical protein